MALKLGKTEKTAISLLIVIAILGAGSYFLIYPKIMHIKETKAKIVQEEKLIETAQQAIEDEKAVTQQFINTAINVKRAEKNFYRELNQIETVDTVKAILDAGGFKSTSGITVGNIKAVSLAVQPAKDDAVPSYEIRNYSFLTQVEDTTPAEGAAAGTAAADTTTAAADPNAAAAPATDPTAATTTVSLQDALKKIGQGWISAEDTVDMSDADKTLYADQLQISEEERAQLMDVIRNALKSNTVQVGEITADITLNMTYPRYLEFLKYINTLKRATYITKVEQNLIANPGNYPHDFNIELSLLVIREMEMPSVFKDTPELNEAVDEESANADEEIAAADKAAADQIKKGQEQLDADGKVVTNEANKPPVTTPAAAQTVVVTTAPLVITQAQSATVITEAPIPATRSAQPAA
jgi:hypothetical protein